MRLVYNDIVNYFKDIFERSNEKRINQFLTKGIYNFVNGLSPTKIDNAFTTSENPYNLRNFQAPYSSNKRTVKVEIETVVYMKPQI